MKLVSLFAGIGGFDLAADWIGWDVIAHCEWNEFGQLVLKEHWPKAITYDDITKTDFSLLRGRVDILTGGFPCQPYSVAGKRKGKEDERHLWPEMLRAIREIQPRWVVGENVRGIINWNGGLVFDEVQSDLEAEGYKILPFLLPAASVNAPHERYRTWFVAYKDTNSTIDGGKETTWDKRIHRNTSSASEMDTAPFTNSNSCTKGSSGTCNCAKGIRGENNDEQNKWRNEAKQHTRCDDVLWDVTDTASSRLERARHDRVCEQETKPEPSRFRASRISSNSTSTRQPSEEHREIESGWIAKESFRDDWQNFPTQSPVCDGDDGFPTESLRQFFREDSNGIISEEEIDKILYQAYGRWRNETIKAGGNAIVPQVVYQIFKAIEQHEQV